MGNENLISGAAQQVGNVDFVVVPIFSIAASVAVVLHYKSTIRVFFAQSSPGGEAQCLRAKRTPKQLNREKRKKKKKRKEEDREGGTILAGRFLCVLCVFGGEGTPSVASTAPSVASAAPTRYLVCPSAATRRVVSVVAMVGGNWKLHFPGFRGVHLRSK